jgi:hypothetical protein
LINETNTETHWSIKPPSKSSSFSFHDGFLFRDGFSFCGGVFGVAGLVVTGVVVGAVGEIVVGDSGLILSEVFDDRDGGVVNWS